MPADKSKERRAHPPDPTCESCEVCVKVLADAYSGVGAAATGLTIENVEVRERVTSVVPFLHDVMRRC